MDLAPRFTQTRDDAGLVLTVLDSSTGLEWSAKPVGEDITHEEAGKLCSALRLGDHDDWRLPTRQELLSLVDLNRFSPAIDTDAFPDFPSSWFWTSDLCAWSSASAWLVYFYGGYVNYDRRYSYGFALAVRRAGQ